MSVADYTKLAIELCAFYDIAAKIYGNLQSFVRLRQRHFDHADEPCRLEFAANARIRQGMFDQRRPGARRASDRKLQDQAERSRHRLLAKNWRQKAAEYDENLEIVRTAIRRMDDLKTYSEAAYVTLRRTTPMS